MDPLSLLIYLLVFVVVAAIIFYIAQSLGLPQNMVVAILLICVLIFLLWILRGGGVF